MCHVSEYLDGDTLKCLPSPGNAGSVLLPLPSSSFSPSLHRTTASDRLSSVLSWKRNARAGVLTSFGLDTTIEVVQ